MRLIEIRPKENIVIADGVSLKLDFEVNENYSVVYWDESVSSGFIETVEGKGKVIKSFNEFSSIMESFQAKLNSSPANEDPFIIIPEDNSVTVNSVHMTIDCSGLDSNYHAIHFDGETGFIETKSGINLSLVDIYEFSDVLEAHAELVEEYDAKLAAEEEEYNLPENLWKREIAATDADLPRTMEDIIDALEDHVREAIDGHTLSKYEDKKLIRSQKPKEV